MFKYDQNLISEEVADRKMTRRTGAYMNEAMVKEILDQLEIMYPDAGCALEHQNPFELLVATVLSAQTTDKSVNLVTAPLFEKYPDAFCLAEADPADVEKIIRTIGLYKTKTINIIGLSCKLVREFKGEVPGDYEQLISLPGVGRKTANVVLSVGFGEQRIAVDTHVFRVANRIGLAEGENVLETEESLMRTIPKQRWTRTHHSLIFHGRNLCSARKPKCEECRISKYCRYYRENNEKREKAGRAHGL